MNILKKYFFLLILLPLFPAYLYADEDEMKGCIVLFYQQKEDAFYACKDFADDDNDLAQRILGDMYYWGWGGKVKKDIKKAINWYKKAAQNGNVDAKYNLGVIYERGDGIEIDYEKAARWFLSAAKDGHKDAQYNLANMYSKGAGYSLNQTKATKWYLAAANQGDVTSQFNLGNRYAIGKGVSKDMSESYKWYYLATMQGDEGAKKQLLFLEKTIAQEYVEKGKLLAEKWRPTVQNNN